MKDYFGIVYKATNENNKKSYIGITTVSLEMRKSQHKSDAKNGKRTVFHHAINKYSWKAFKWEEIDKAKNLQELFEKERKWIEYFRTYIKFNDCNGYNMTIGGEGTIGVSTNEVNKVIQVKELLRDTTLRYKKIGNVTGVSPHTVKDIYQGKSWNHVIVDGFLPNMERDIGYFIEVSVIKQIKLKLMEDITTKQEISQQFNVSNSLVTAIAQSELHSDVYVEGFEERMGEIRKNKNSHKVELVRRVKQLLIEGITQTETSLITGSSINFVASIKNSNAFKDVYVKGFDEWRLENPKIIQSDDLPDNVVIDIKRSLMKGIDPTSLANKHKIDRIIVYNIRKGKSYSHINVPGFKPLVTKEDWNIGSNNPTAILDVQTINLIRQLAERKKCNQRQIADFFYTTPTNISDIVKERIWKHVKPVDIHIQHLQDIEKEINIKFPNKRNKLTSEQVIDIKKLLFYTNEPMESIAKKFNISRKHVEDINRKVYYSDIKLKDEPEGAYRNTQKTSLNSQTSNAKLNETLVKEIRIKFMNGVRSIEIERYYNLSSATVYSIKYLKSWKWVDVEGYKEYLKKISRKG